MLLFYYSHGDFPILSLLHPEIENVTLSLLPSILYLAMMCWW